MEQYERLEAAVANINDNLQILSAKVIDLSSDVKHLVSANIALDDVRTRVIKLEVKLEAAEKFREQQSNTNKWLIGVVISIILAMITTGFAVMITVANHWK